MGICVSHLNHQYKIETNRRFKPEDILQQTWVTGKRQS